ncbi:PHP domain-containing protein [Nocardioides yefusunii]|uniref:PHP domain-containing protein n=1 Tax=Nocardioides yefusunii TaxID=2500546 RepID=A0ABW1R0W1_9ACTN|nr:PHP domain-containing protein [Nocardioides yefusunii]
MGDDVETSDLRRWCARPEDALRRTAFLLELAREDTYKVRAYRTALATVVATDDDELLRRHRGSTLTELPGLGASTAGVVGDVLDGRVPQRLRRAADLAAASLPAGGGSLRAALRGDLHSHTDASDGGSSVQEMALAALEIGHEYLVVTDHSPSLKVAHGLSAHRLRTQGEEIAALTAALADTGLSVLRGIEVDILPDGSLDQDEALLAELDVRVASVHSHLRSDAVTMTTRMLTAVRNPLTNVLGHCTGRLVTGARGTRGESEFDAEAVFAACRDHDVAVEINSRPERRDPPTRLLELARDLGCLFAIDSDAHAPGQLELVRHGCARAEEAGIPAERIVNTWPKQQLLAWSTQ